MTSSPSSSSPSEGSSLDIPPFEIQDADQLWSALLRRDRAAFAEFYRMVYAPILIRARSALTANGVRLEEVSAQDLVQSVMLQIWRKKDKLELNESDGLLGFWKLTCHIISQKAIDRRRKQAAQKRPQIVRDATACDDESGIAQVLLQTASRERAPDEEIAVKDYFDDLYARLPEDCRSVFALWVQGLTADEIGAALGHDRSWAWRKIDKIKRWWRKESDS